MTAVKCALLAAATVLVYLNAFPGAFHFDDFPLLLDNPIITAAAFDYGHFLTHYGGRPLTLWSFHVNLRLMGENPAGFLIVNLLLHALVVAAVFLLVRALWDSEKTAFLAALLFGLHPLATQPVNYIWSRSVLLMALFALLSLAAARGRPWMAMLFLQLAVWSRAEAVILVLPLVWLGRSLRPVLLASVNLAVLFGFALSTAPRQMLWTHSDPLGYWWVQPVAFWKYVGLMLTLGDQSVDHALTPPGIWWTLAAVAGLAGLAAAAFAARARRPGLSGGILWILLALAPSMLVPNAVEFSESRAYLALVGFSVLAAALLVELARSRARLTIAAVAVLGLLVPATLERNALWRLDSALWQDAVLKSPGLVRPRYNLGVALTHEGKTRQARVEFQRVLELDPGEDMTWAAIGYCLEEDGDRQRAAAHYRRAIALNPQNGYALRRLLAAQKGAGS